MRGNSVGFYLALGLGTLGLSLALASGCGQLWRPFLDPTTEPAVADLASAPDAGPVDMGMSWIVEPSGTKQNLYGVWGIRQTSALTTVTDGGVTTTMVVTQLPVFAVGAAGTIVRRDYDDAAWRPSPLPTPTNLNLYAVTGHSPTDVTAVGQQQLVVQWDGTSWDVDQVLDADAFLTIVPVGTRSNYLAVGAAGTFGYISGRTRSLPTAYMAVPDDLTSIYSDATRTWFGTNAGYLLKYEQGNFLIYKLSPAGAVRALWGRSAKDIWAVGDSGYVARFDGTDWRASTTGLPESSLNLYGVTGSSRGEVWVVGDNGTILYFNQSVWSLWQHPSGLTLHGIYREPGSGELWVVGEQGLILHGGSLGDP